MKKSNLGNICNTVKHREGTNYPNAPKPKPSLKKANLTDNVAVSDVSLNWRMLLAPLLMTLLINLLAE